MPSRANGLADLWDIEGHLCAAAIDALKAVKIPATEMLRGEDRVGTRAEVVCMLNSETGAENISHKGERYRSQYTAGLTISIRSSPDDYPMHRKLRGNIRSKFIWPCGLGAFNDHLDYYEVFNIRAQETTHFIDEENHDELASDMSFLVDLAIHPGSFPI